MDPPNGTPGPYSIARRLLWTTFTVSRNVGHADQGAIHHEIWENWGQARSLPHSENCPIVVSKTSLLKQYEKRFRLSLSFLSFTALVRLFASALRSQM